MWYSFIGDKNYARILADNLLSKWEDLYTRRHAGGSHSNYTKFALAKKAGPVLPGERDNAGTAIQHVDEFRHQRNFRASERRKLLRRTISLRAVHK